MSDRYGFRDRVVTGLLNGVLRLASRRYREDLVLALREGLFKLAQVGKGPYEGVRLANPPFTEPMDDPEPIDLPPDRLTPEEIRALLHRAGGGHGDLELGQPTYRDDLKSAKAKLKARLADREPEKP